MRSLFSIICLFSFFSSLAQESKMKRYKVHDDHVPVICKAHHSDHQHIVPRAATPRNTIKNPAVFIIDYDDNIPVNAIPAVEFAAEILSAGLSSTIPIRVQVIWGAQNIESGTLAFARPSEYIVDFPNSTEKVAYPIALAEKLSGMHINSESEPDIIVTVNSDKQWYYGFDNPEGIRNGEFDLATVMLHEVTHGLGFTGFAGIADDGVTGFMKFNFDTGNFDKNGTPVIFNLYNTDGSGQNLCRSFEDQTTRLGNALLSNNLFLKTPKYEISTAPRLYAPTTYDSGSSLHHLDLMTYQNTDDALMRPQINSASSIHDLGISLDILQEIGWASTHLLHKGIEFQEDLDEPLVITAKVESDFDYDANSVILYYSQDTFKTVETITMTPTGQADEYTHTIEATGETANYQYYFTLIDSRNITLPFPQEGPDPLFFETFYFGDMEKPVLQHTPVRTIDDKTVAIPIDAQVTDFFTGVDSVFIEYFVNGQFTGTTLLGRDFSDEFRDNLYAGIVDLAASLSTSDKLEYRVVAIDKSISRNQITNPTTGLYEIEISETFNATITYINDFNATSSDFQGDGFSLDQPSGFSDEGIQSQHPYPNAGNDRTLNFNYQLNIPIQIREVNPLIEFEEVVLVEPGEVGTNYTQAEFWDYVIVEGKTIDGQTWLPFLDGYDSRANSDWLRAYNNGIQGRNSQTDGSPDLFAPRTISMVESGNFQAGDIVFVRFRLFSDPFAFGWGWAIDNLRIQDNMVAVEDFINQENFIISPNPSTTSHILVEANFKKAVDNLQINIYDNVGRLLVTKSTIAASGQIKEAIDVDKLTSGIYFVNMRINGVEQISRKIVIE